MIITFFVNTTYADQHITKTGIPISNMPNVFYTELKSYLDVIVYIYIDFNDRLHNNYEIV